MGEQESIGQPAEDNIDMESRVVSQARKGELGSLCFCPNLTPYSRSSISRSRNSDSLLTCSFVSCPEAGMRKPAATHIDAGTCSMWLSRDKILERIL